MCALLLFLCAAVAPVRAHEPPSPKYQTHVVGEVPPLDLSSASEVHIGRAQLDVMPRRSLEDVLRLIPGAMAVQHGAEGKGQQIFLRGFDAEHGSDIEVTLEGIPLNQPSHVHGHGYLDLAFIPVEVLNSVDVVKGPFEAAQGDFATAGSIRLRLGVPEQRRGLWSRYIVGNTQRHRGSVVWAPPGAATNTFLAAEGLTDAGFGARRGARRASLFGSVRLSELGDPLGQWDAMGALYVGRFDLPGALRWDDVRDARMGFYDAYTNDSGGSSAFAMAALAHKWGLGRGVLSSHLYVQLRTMTLRENFTGFLVDPNRGDARGQNDDSVRLGARSSYLQRLRHDLQLRSALSWQGTYLNQNEARADDTPNGSMFVRNMTAAQQHGAAESEVSYALNAHLQLSAGGRADVWHFSPHDKISEVKVAPEISPTLLQISPRLHAGFSPWPFLTLFAGFGQGVRSPEARAFARPQQASSDDALPRGRAGDPRVTVSHTAEVGLRYAAGTTFLASASAFGTWIDREQIFDHVAGTNLERNGTRRLGTELSLVLRPTSYLHFGGDVTLVRAQFVDSGAPVPAAPTRVLSLLAILNHPTGWFGSLRMSHVGPRALMLGARAGSFTVASAMVGLRLRRWEITLEVDNLLKHQFAEGEYHFASAWRGNPSAGALPAGHFVAGSPRLVRAGVAFAF